MTEANERLPILTVGYGLREADELIALLQRNGAEYVGDVRSVPYSRRRPQFSREAFERLLRAAGLRYVFLGETLGGRPDDPACYDADGHVDYDLCRTAPSFLAGIERVETAYREGHRLALLCSEARPTDCHRSKLLAEMLVERDVPVTHIDEGGNLVEHAEIAARLHGSQLSLVADALGRSRRAYRAA
ncbi:MAG: DUF488 domain-containing protein [Gaiella sp.]|nr:DUF488 domain-containing protein [Gaiella sp.]